MVLYLQISCHLLPSPGLRGHREEQRVAEHDHAREVWSRVSGWGTGWACSGNAKRIAALLVFVGDSMPELFPVVARVRSTPIGRESFRPRPMMLKCAG